MLHGVKTSAAFRKTLAQLVAGATHPTSPGAETVTAEDGAMALTGGPVLRKTAFSTAEAWREQAHADLLFYQAARLNMLHLLDDIDTLLGATPGPLTSKMLGDALGLGGEFLQDASLNDLIAIVKKQTKILAEITNSVQKL